MCDVCMRHVHVAVVGPRSTTCVYIYLQYYCIYIYFLCCLGTQGRFSRAYLPKVVQFIGLYLDVNNTGKLQQL